MFITRIIENLVSFRRVPIKVVVITALASYILQLGAIVQGYPLYIIAIFTMLPWIPVVFFEGAWKIEHYNVAAIFAIIVILQLGHLGEHVTQVAQLEFLSGTLACPPPVDNTTNANLAVESGLRPSDVPPSGLSSANVVQNDPTTGFAKRDANGQEIVGPASCGVLGQLDLEIVHLVWEILGWFAIIWLLGRYPRNIWLWISLIAASIHAVEHFFISWVFFIDNDLIFNGAKQLWGTTLEGRIVTAHPVGLQEQLVSFYDAGGKAGIVGRGGMLDQLTNGNLTSLLPTRPVLHFGYNLVITLPLIPAFLYEVRRMYDEYLAKALPALSEDQLVAVTPKLEPMRFSEGEEIIKQDDIADHFYIITKGEVEVVREEANGKELSINKLGSGQFFGEIGLLQGGRRMATIRALSNVEVMALDRHTFQDLLAESEMSEQEVNAVVQKRIQQVETMQGSR